jgi:hypothetical protein
MVRLTSEVSAGQMPVGKLAAKPDLWARISCKTNAHFTENPV